MRKIASITLALCMLAIAACSSSVGSGTPPPQDVNVVVPPGSR